MSSITAAIEERLAAAFPQRLVSGAITPHECDECATIRDRLCQSSWGEVPDDFVDGFYSGSLPLLSPDAYNAYLPIWLRCALRRPNGNAAAMVVINLGDDPGTHGITREQASVIIDVVRFVANNNHWTDDDPNKLRSVAAVEAVWVPIAV